MTVPVIKCAVGLLAIQLFGLLPFLGVVMVIVKIVGSAGISWATIQSIRKGKTNKPE